MPPRARLARPYRRHGFGDATDPTPALPPPDASSGPFFIPDIYENDLGPSPNFGALAVQPGVVGCIIKATQGVTYSPAWFTRNWNAVGAAGAARYDSWFRGCYHFATPTPGGAAQADYYLKAVQAAGGWGATDIAPIYDLEGTAWSSAQQIVDVGSAFADAVAQATGKTPILYAGALIRDLHISDRMGYGRMFSPHLDMSGAGWSALDFALWQYAGDGKLYDPASAVYGYPTAIDGWGATDMSVVYSGGSPATDIDQVRSILTGATTLSPSLIIGAAALFLLAALHRR